MKRFTKNLFLIVLLLIVIVACSSKHLEESEKTVEAFFDALRADNVDNMIDKYENIILFDSYYKSDSIKISNSIKINDSLIKIQVENYFTNGFGKLSNKEIILFVTPDSTNAFSRILDSKGLTDYSENELYSFAKKTGCLKKIDTTDVMINLKLVAAKDLSQNIQLETLINFIENVSVVDWNWETGYGNSASGKGIVKNNSSFSIPNVKYTINYKDKNGNVLTSDDGYVAYNKIEPGESKSFTFYTSYVGHASRASIMLDFDEKMIEEYVLNTKEYNGDEYEQFQNQSE